MTAGLFWLRRRGRLPAGAAVLLLLSACRPAATTLPMDDPQMVAYTKLVLPARIEILRYWTRPVSFAGTGEADGLELVLAAYDSAGDLTKMVGTLHAELYTRRPASSDRRDRRIGFWKEELNSAEALLRRWDRVARFYNFPLGGTPLPPGEYILDVWLAAPSGERLSDEYEFTCPAGAAPPPSSEHAPGR